MYKPRSPVNSSKYSNISPSPSNRKKPLPTHNHVELASLKTKSRLSSYVQNVKTQKKNTIKNKDIKLIQVDSNQLISSLDIK